VTHISLWNLRASYWLVKTWACFAGWGWDRWSQQCQGGSTVGIFSLLECIASWHRQVDFLWLTSHTVCDNYIIIFTVLKLFSSPCLRRLFQLLSSLLYVMVALTQVSTLVDHARYKDHNWQLAELRFSGNVCKLKPSVEKIFKILFQCSRIVT
jgi:hypothetical protein